MVATGHMARSAHHGAVHELRESLTTRLAAGLAHEAKNPLNAMAINLEILADKLRREDGTIPEGLQKNLAAARAQIGRVDEIVRRFADLAAERHEGAAELHALIERAVRLCEHDIKRAGTAIRVDVPAGLRVSSPPGQVVVLLAALLLGWGTGAARGETLLVTGGDEPGGARVTARVQGEGPAEAERLAVQHAAAAIGARLSQGGGFELYLPGT